MILYRKNMPEIDLHGEDRIGARIGVSIVRIQIHNNMSTQQYRREFKNLLEKILLPKDEDCYTFRDKANKGTKLSVGKNVYQLMEGM